MSIVEPYDYCELTAVFKKLYDVYIDILPAEGGTASGEGTYNEGDNVTLTAVPSEGYAFDGWYHLFNGEEVLDSKENSYVISGIDYNVYEIAKFVKKTYTVSVTADPAEGGTVTGSGAYNEGDEVTLTAVPNEGYVFDYWSVWEGGIEHKYYTNPYVIPELAGDYTLTAVFKKGYTVKLIASPAEGGTVTGGGTYTYDLAAELTAVANEGFTFAGWYYKGELYAGPDFNPLLVTVKEPNEYVEFTARFVEKGYTINAIASPAEGGEVFGCGTYAYDTTAALMAVPNEGYEFVGWYNGDVFFTDTNPVGVKLEEPNEYGELTAKFVKKGYTVTASASPAEGGTVTGSGTYAYEEKAVLTAAPNEGYEFVGWYSGNEFITNSNSLTVGPYDEPYEIEATAKFIKKTYSVSVTADPAEGGTVTGGGTYEYGAEVTMTAAPNAGYTFVGWYVLDDEYDEFYLGDALSHTLRDVDDNYSYIAKFEKIAPTTYTVTVNASEGGTASGGGTFEQGASATVTAAANDGYTFDGWYDGSTKVSAEAAYVFTVTKNIILTAKFTKNAPTTYTVTATASEGGTASGGGTFVQGANATVTAAANDGFTFSGWYEGDTKVSDSASYTFTVTKNVTLTAKFEKNAGTFTVTVLASPAAGGVVRVVGETSSFASGATAIVTAEANDGYTFDGWYDGSAKVSAEAAYVFTVTKNVILTAKFTKNAPTTYTVTATASEGGTASGGGSFEQGASATVIAAANSGYRFAGWYDGSTKVSDSASYTFAVTKNVALTAKFEKDVQPAKIAIRNFEASKTVDYRTTITFTAVLENPVAGAEVRWYVDGKDVGSGETYTVKEAKNNFNVQAKYVKGSDVLAESGIETVNVKSGFFAKLKAFFRALFGKLPVVVQEYFGVEFIDRVLP